MPLPFVNYSEDFDRLLIAVQEGNIFVDVCQTELLRQGCQPYHIMTGLLKNICYTAHERRVGITQGRGIDKNFISMHGVVVQQEVEQE